MTYYMDLLEKGGRGAYIALGVLALAVLFVVLQAVLAYGRGTSRSVARFLVVIACAGVAFYATRIVGRAYFPNKTVGEVLKLSSTRFAPIMEAPASELLLPIAFVLIFFLLSLLAVIPFKLFCGIFGFSYERNNGVTRGFAVLVGAVHGLFTLFILMLPIFGGMRMYERAAVEKPTSVVADIYDRYFEDTVESPLYKYPMEFIGDRVMNEFTESTK